MSTLKNGAWVLVADGEKALFLENITDGEDPYLKVRRIEEQENPPTREQAANRPGRVQESATHGSRSYEDTAWHQLEKDRFADDLAEILYRQAHKGAFDHLVIVAPPRVLGEMREKMHQEVTDKIVAEIDKTLTNHPINEIEEIVSKAMAA
ncbi:MAG: host attachment protein [Silicimonas sp.]|nr:host attachment protein [Silicimonas sp.]